MNSRPVNEDFYWGIDMRGDAPLQRLYRRAVAHLDLAFRVVAESHGSETIREVNRANELIRNIMALHTRGII